MRAQELLTILDDDDGSGWVEVENARGEKGVVPASYLVRNKVENGGGDGAGGGGRRKAPPPPVKKSTAGGKRGMFVINLCGDVADEGTVKVLYDYTPQTKDELGLEEGETLELVEGGDKDPGWWEGVKDGRKGLFPANYVSLM